MNVHDQMDEPERRLPVELRSNASVSGGEYAWRVGDVEAVIKAASDRGLACLGGQVQWRFPDGTCEAYWLNYDSEDRALDEAWNSYVRRSCSEVLRGFRRMLTAVDWEAEAMEWAFIRDKVIQEGQNPDDFRWCVLYFAAETASEG